MDSGASQIPTANISLCSIHQAFQWRYYLPLLGLEIFLALQIAMETDIQIDYDLVTSSRMRDQSVTSLGPLLCNLYEWEEDFLMCLHSDGTPCWPSVPKVVGSNPAERPKAMNRKKVKWL